MWHSMLWNVKGLLIKVGKPFGRVCPGWTDWLTLYRVCVWSTVVSRWTNFIALTSQPGLSHPGALFSHSFLIWEKNVIWPNRKTKLPPLPLLNIEPQCQPYFCPVRRKPRLFEMKPSFCFKCSIAVQNFNYRNLIYVVLVREWTNAFTTGLWIHRLTLTPSLFFR